MMTPDHVLTFWFAGDSSVWRDVWFKKDAAFDAACGAFASVLHDARTGAFDTWADTPRGALALLILLDQLSRNLYRGSADAFAADPKARRVARAAIDRGFDRALAPNERVFMYLPFEHTEDLADQDDSVRLFETLRGSIGDTAADSARKHQELIQRFGRFPHRNAALGRVSTPEEEDYLAQPGAGF